MAIMGTGDDISIFSNLSNPGILAWGHEMAYPYGPAGPLQVQSEIELANQLGFSVVTTNIDVITATAYVMYHDADLREATVRDVDDEPIVVPWFEHVTYGGGPDPTLMTWAEHPDTSEGNQGVLEVEINFGACASHYVRTYESFQISDGDEVATSWSYDIYLPADIPDGMRIYAWVGNVPWAAELSYFQTVGDSGSTLVPGEWNTLHYPITEKIDAGLFTADDSLRIGWQHWPNAEDYTATIYLDNFILHGIGEYVTVGIEITGEQQQPTEFHLSQAYPNPFNPVTNLNYSLVHASEVSIVIYNLMGRPIRTLVSGHEAAGSHRVYWDGTNEAGGRMSSGVYLLKMTTPTFSQTQKIMLLK